MCTIRVVTCTVIASFPTAISKHVIVYCKVLLYNVASVTVLLTIFLYSLSLTFTVFANCQVILVLITLVDSERKILSFSLISYSKVLVLLASRNKL